MPTPFYHLSLAQELLERPDLSPLFQDEVENYQAEFLFGNIAPDVQVVSGQPRAETHFFDLPLRQNLLKPWELLWQTYPQLTVPSNLKLEQRAFLLGY
ncbi:MAG: zinc dependent phospholipase C family protein, partial [Anaerolineales bacterium]